MGLTLNVRPASIEDAVDVVRLARSLSIINGVRTSRLTEAAYRRDGFGDQPAFYVLIAEINETAVGYVLYYPGYDTVRATRGIYLADLYVDDGYRRLGVGRALMRALAKACCDLGGEWMFWSVLKRNRVARKFYRTLAPELKNVVLCAALGDSFERLAR